MSRWRSVAAWAALGAGTVAGAAGLGALGIPSPTLMAALLVGIAWALRGPFALDAARPVSTGAEAVLGVAIGAYVERGTLEALGADLPVVLAINLATLGLSVLAGAVLVRLARGDVDEPTAAFGMIAGGASGIVAMSRELGADQRLVAVMQYLRVLVIVLLTPVLAVVVYGAGGGAADAAVLDETSLPQAAGLCAVSVGIGLPLARSARIPAGSVLGPMVVAAVFTVSGAPFAGALPALVQDVAFAVIGLIVGLRFTPESLRAAGRLLGPALLCTFGVLVGCALVGAALAPLAGVTQLDAYLATTPGGLYAVLATAIGSDADATFVLAVQVLRLLVMLLAAPLLARRLTAAAAARGAARPSR